MAILEEDCLGMDLSIETVKMLHEKVLPKLKRIMVKKGLIPDTYVPKKHKREISGAGCRETVDTSSDEGTGHEKSNEGSPDNQGSFNIAAGHCTEKERYLYV